MKSLELISGLLNRKPCTAESWVTQMVEKLVIPWRWLKIFKQTPFIPPLTLVKRTPLINLTYLEFIGRGTSKVIKEKLLNLIRFCRDCRSDDRTKLSLANICFKSLLSMVMCGSILAVTNPPCWAHLSISRGQGAGQIQEIMGLHTQWRLTPCGWVHTFCWLIIEITCYTFEGFF